MMQNSQRLRLSLIVELFVCLFLALTAIAQTPGTFAPTGNMTTARAGHTATLLPDGRVLIVGGDEMGTAELYDPATGMFAPTGDMTTGHGGTTDIFGAGSPTVLLLDGRVLIIGSTKSELYDPVTGSFAPTGNLVTPQREFTATLLTSGKVLISGGWTGGYTDCCAIAANPELYDPATGTFSLAGPYADTGAVGFGGISADTSGFTGSAAILLPDGKVLILSEPAAELYDPVTNTFSLTGSMVSADEAGFWGKPTEISGRTATLMANGKVLVTGGEPAYYDTGDFPLSRAEVYDISSRNFTATSSMHAARLAHTATLLPDGTTLIAGGRTDLFYDATALTERYDPSVGAFSVVANMKTGRFGHQATLLRDGRVLITGGLISDTYPHSQALASAELYQDPWQDAINAMKASAGTDSLNLWQWAWYWQSAPAFSGAPSGFGLAGSISPFTIADIILAGGGNGSGNVTAEQWVSYYRGTSWQKAITAMQAASRTDSLNFWQWAWYWQRAPRFAGAPAGFGLPGSIDNNLGTMSAIIVAGGGNGSQIISAEQWVAYTRQVIPQ